jgi:diaminopimelate decarboxylase
MYTEYTGPYYRFNLSLLEETLTAAMNAAQEFNIALKYAMKANNESKVLVKVKESGIGVDCVSMQEIARALEIGWAAREVVFAGSGKTIREIHYALSRNIGVIHCESFEEWEIIAQLRQDLGSSTAVALRINPDVRVDTHSKISTGEKHHKFGMSFDDALRIIALDASIVGFHFHVGSQILDLQYFEDLSLTVRGLLARLPENFALRYLNMGGGLGVDYDHPERNRIADFNGWMAAIRTHLPTSLIETIHLEPGRSITAQCGTLIGEVQYIKNRDTHPTAILDIGMTELLRPALYGSRHKITVQHDSIVTERYTISGPSCESSDTFGQGYNLTELSRGDLVTIHSTGAYCTSMRLSYNLKEALPVYYYEEMPKTCLRVGLFSLAS